MENAGFLLLQFLSLLALSMFWFRIFGWKAETSICMAMAVVMALVFVCGFFGNAQAALWILSLLSAAGLLLFVLGERVPYLAGRTLPRRDFFTPGVVLLCLVFLYGVICFHGIKIKNWDELSQWAKCVNAMLADNRLPFGADFDSSDALLSATTMFHYYFCKLPSALCGTVVESNMYVSNLVLWFGAAMLPLSGMKRRQWKRCAAYAVVVFLAMNLLFVQPYYNIYCDQPLTMWTGALIAWVLFGERERYGSVLILLSLLNIGFMKSMMGPLFGCICLVVLLIRFVTEQGGARAVIQKQWKERRRLKGLYAAGCVLAVFFFSLLWSWYTGENAVIRSTLPVGDQSNRVRLTLASGLPKIFESVTRNGNFPVMTFFLALVFTVLIGALLYRQFTDERLRRQYTILLVLYSVGFAGFFVLMMGTYLTVFSYADSIGTGSLNRYLSDYILIGLIPVTFPAFRRGNGVQTRGGGAMVIALLLFFALGTSNDFVGKATALELSEDSAYQARLSMDSYKEAALEMMDSDEKIYMINQNRSGYRTVAADYVFGQLLDKPGMCYYFTEEEDETIIGLSAADIRALPDILLDGYGYLWIYKTDDYFDAQAFDVLKIPTPENGDFYKVEQEDGRLKLRYLGNLKQ